MRYLADAREAIKECITAMELQIYRYKASGCAEDDRGYRNATKAHAKCIGMLAYIESLEWVERE
jgi:hypothetical protein